MSLSTLLLAVWLILVGLTWAAIYSVDAKFLGLFAILTGVIWLVEAVHPFNIPRP